MSRALATFSWTARRIRRGVCDRGGSTLPVYAIALSVLCLAVGAGIDYARAGFKRDHLQAALDTAVLSAALDGTDEFATAGAHAFAAQIDGPARDAARTSFDRTEKGVVTGVAETELPLVFAGLLGLDTVRIRVTAQAAPPAGHRVCVLLLGSGSQALRVDAGATVRAPECEVHVHSQAVTAVQTGTDSRLGVARVCVAGRSVQIDGETGGDVEVGCKPVEDDLAADLPIPASETCDFESKVHDGGDAPLKPGVYCGEHIFNPAARVTLSAGLYVIRDGAWNLSGGVLVGRNVTIYLAENADLRLSKSVRTRLTAPNGGATAGILLYEWPGAPKNRLALTIADKYALEGLVHLPSREVVVSGGRNQMPDSLTIVADSMTIKTTDWSLKPSRKGLAVDDGKSSEALFLTQ